MPNLEKSQTPWLYFTDPWETPDLILRFIVPRCRTINSLNLRYSYSARIRIFFLSMDNSCKTSTIFIHADALLISFFILYSLEFWLHSQNKWLKGNSNTPLKPLIEFNNYIFTLYKKTSFGSSSCFKMIKNPEEDEFLSVSGSS